MLLRSISNRRTALAVPLCSLRNHKYRVGTLSCYIVQTPSGRKTSCFCVARLVIAYRLYLVWLSLHQVITIKLTFSWLGQWFTMDLAWCLVFRAACSLLPCKNKADKVITCVPQIMMKQTFKQLLLLLFIFFSLLTV